MAIEGIAAAGYHVVQEGQAVVDGQVRDLEDLTADTCVRPSGIYRLRPLTDEEVL